MKDYNITTLGFFEIYCDRLLKRPRVRTTNFDNPQKFIKQL